MVRWFKKLMPVTPDYRGDKFFVRENGLRMATPLFIVLLLVEFTDLIFAVDSIPRTGDSGDGVFLGASALRRAKGTAARVRRQCGLRDWLRRRRPATD